MELYEVCTICQTEAHEGEYMCRLICRHTFHYICWAAAVAVGSGPNREQTATCPNCKERGHVAACWNRMDTFITTQPNPQTGQEAPNLLGAPEPQTPRRPVRIAAAVTQRPDQLHTSERDNAQQYQIWTPSSQSIAWGTATPGELDEEGFFCYSKHVHRCQ